MSTELKTGIISIVIIALGIWGYNFLKGQNILNSSTRYFQVEYDNIKGLSKASSVTINGFSVGKVQKITFNEDPKKRGGLIVKFSVDNDFEFSKNSTVKIYSPSPLGGSNLAIIPSYDGKMAVSGDFLSGNVEPGVLESVGDRLEPIQERLESVLTNVDTLVVGLNNVLNAEAQKSLNNSLLSVEATINGLQKTVSSVNSMVDSNKANLTATLDNTKKITDDFSKISDDLAKVNIAETVQKLEQSLADVNTLIADVKNGKGSLGKLVSDDKMYVNLTNASKELEELLREMKLNPKRFVHFSLFGKKPKPYNEQNNKNNISNSQVKD